jgi:hypothetical protein
MSTQKKVEENDPFANLESLTKPRDLAWSNWFQFKNVGDQVQGYVRDAFYRPAEGLFKEQRGITLQQKDGTYVNVAIKRLPFILNKTDDLRMGDLLAVKFESEAAPSQKGFSATKVFGYYGKQLPENAQNKTVKQSDDESRGTAPSMAPTAQAVDESEGVPFP